MRDGFDLFHTIGNRNGESDPLQDRYIYKIIAYEADLFCGNFESFKHIVKRDALIEMPCVGFDDLQIAGPQLYDT